MIDKKTRNCKVIIFGESYSLVTTQAEEHVVRAAELVDSYMKEIAQKIPNSEEKKCAVLTALRIASRVLQLEMDAKEGMKKEERLIAVIEQELMSNTHNIL